MLEKKFPSRFALFRRRNERLLLAMKKINIFFIKLQLEKFIYLASNGDESADLRHDAGENVHK